MKLFIAGSASDKINKKYFEGIEKIAEYITQNGHSIVYIGSGSGTIGKMCKEVQKRGGIVDVFVPEVYASEAEHMTFNSKKIVDSLFTVQQLFLHNSDVTLVLPGGNGTLAELFMITDNIKTKFDTDPVLIYNVNGFYNCVKDTIDFMKDAGAMTDIQYKYFNFFETPQAIIKELEKIDLSLKNKSDK